MVFGVAGCFFHCSIVLALVFMPGRKQNELSYQQFKQVLESGDVGSLIIYQNEQTANR